MAHSSGDSLNAAPLLLTIEDRTVDRLLERMASLAEDVPSPSFDWWTHQILLQGYKQLEEAHQRVASSSDAKRILASMRHIRKAIVRMNVLKEQQEEEGQGLKRPLPSSASAVMQSKKRSKTTQSATDGSSESLVNSTLTNLLQHALPSFSSLTCLRLPAWKGVIEFPDNAQVLKCTIVCHFQKGDPTFETGKWSEKLHISSQPGSLLSYEAGPQWEPLSCQLIANSFHISFHFADDSPGLAELLDMTMSADQQSGSLYLLSCDGDYTLASLAVSKDKMLVGFIPHPTVGEIKTEAN